MYFTKCISLNLCNVQFFLNFLQVTGCFAGLVPERVRHLLSSVATLGAYSIKFCGSVNYKSSQIMAINLYVNWEYFTVLVYSQMAVNHKGNVLLNSQKHQEYCLLDEINRTFDFLSGFFKIHSSSV